MGSYFQQPEDEINEYIPTYQQPRGYNPPAMRGETANYFDQLQANAAAAEQLAGINALQHQAEVAPEMQQLGDITRESQIKSGLARLAALKEQESIRDDLTKGTFDALTPQGQNRLYQGVLGGTITPAQASAFQRFSPLSDAMSSAIQSIQGIDPTADDAAQQYQAALASVPKEVLGTPKFTAAASNMRKIIDANRSHVNERLTREALESGINPEQLRPFFEGENFHTLKDREGLARAMSEYKRERAIEGRIWTKDDYDAIQQLHQENAERSVRDPTDEEKIAWLQRNVPDNTGQGWNRQPTPEEWRAAYQGWKNEPMRSINSKMLAMENMKRHMMGRPLLTPQEPQHQPGAAAANIQRGAAFLDKLGY